MKLPLRFSLLLSAAAPIWIAYTLVRAWRDGGKRYLQQRLGFGHPDLARTATRNQPLWLHAASVGEIITLIPLLETLADAYPSAPLLLTTNTPTGMSTLQQRLAKATIYSRCTPVYLPVDLRYATRRFLNRYKPHNVLVMETELWPLLYEECGARQLRIVIINGRLSRRSLDAANGWLAPVYQCTVKNVYSVLARSSDDAAHYRQIGARRVQLAGNLKLAQPQADIPAEALVSPPYCLLASTHEDEEHRLVDQWLAADRHELLVIAPRHPDRAATILKQLRTLPGKGTVAVRSRGEQINSDTRIYLADTLGELSAWYAHASAIFVGGSLVPVGGHNLLEPARCGKPAVVGPHMHNFLEDLQELKQYEAVYQEPDAAAVMRKLCHLLDSPTQFHRAGQAALGVTNACGNILQDYATLIHTELQGLDQPRQQASSTR